MDLPDGKRVLLMEPALVHPVQQTQVLKKLIESFHGEPHEWATK